jgi:aryl-alcohol dehydrogenase-like predicted oxidoreductase
VVSRLCLGSLPPSGAGADYGAEFVRTVRFALDHGLNFLDTAPAYGDGYAEELVARAVAGRRRQVVIGTKFSHIDSHPERIRLSLEGSLRRLRTDYVDILYQHWPAPDVSPEDVIAEMERLKEEGKIRAIGVSNWMEPEWERLENPARVDCLQPCHSLLWRSVEPRILPLCRKERIAVLAYSPLCQGILAGRLHAQGLRAQNRRLRPEDVPSVRSVLAALESVAVKYRRTLAQAALRWLLDQPGVTAVIVGASRVEQLGENIGALGWGFDPRDWETLSEASRSLSTNLAPWDTLWGWHSLQDQAGRPAANTRSEI